MASRILSIIFSPEFAGERCAVGVGIGSIFFGSYFGYHAYKKMDDNDSYVEKYWINLASEAILGAAFGATIGAITFSFTPITVPYFIFSALDTLNKRNIKYLKNE
jgi:hypothetical protein